MISIKDYAKQNNVTYEAVRAQVKRYQDELAGHLIKDGRQQFLDDVAVAFLDERRQKNPVVVYQQSKDEAIEELRQEREALYKKIAMQADEINTLQRFKIETMEKRQQLEDAKTAQERRQRELDQREADIAEEVRTAVQEATEATQKAERDKHAQEVDAVRKEAEKAIQAAIKRREDELHLKHQKELQEEQSRAISFKEWWNRRKKGKKNESND